MNQELYEIRHNKLSNIWRFKGYNTPVFYRTNVSSHIQRMKIIGKEICDLLTSLGIRLDTQHILDLIEVHDDEEIITDDIAAPIKEKFSISEKILYENKQTLARENLKNTFQYLFQNPEKYEKLLNEEHFGGTLAYKILKFTDKLEANMEVSHEIFGGNTEVFRFHNVITKEIINGFTFSYERATEALKNLIETIGIEKKELEKYDIFNLSKIDGVTKEKRVPHTVNSLKQIFPYLPYEKRKKLLLENLPEEEKQKLWTKTPFLILM